MDDEWREDGWVDGWTDEGIDGKTHGFPGTYEYEIIK